MTEDEWELRYKIIELFFDRKIRKSDLEKISIFDLQYVYYFIEIYIKKVVVVKFKELGQEEIEIEKSIFDEYDKEEGYVTEEENNIYETLLNLLNEIFRFSIKRCKNSLKECLDTNICDLLDYAKSEMEYIEEHKDDEEGYLD